MPGDRHRDLRVSTDVSELSGRLLYRPAWLVAFQYNGKEYRCVINGQNGQVKGEAAINTFRLAGLIGLVALVIAMIVVLMLVL